MDATGNANRMHMPSSSAQRFALLFQRSRRVADMSPFRLRLACVVAFLRQCCSAPVEDVGAMADLLAVHFPTVPRSNLELAAAGGLLEALEAGSETECARDYGLPCPEAWVDGGDGKTCLPPLGYAGPCSGPIHFEDGATPDLKRQQASACNAQFPCKGACTPDYSKSCPAGWPVEGLECVAPAGYTGSCVTRKSFNGFSWKEKGRWADQCQSRWPCRSPQGASAKVGSEASLRRAGAFLQKVADLSDIESLAQHAESAAERYLAESAKLPSAEQARNLIALQNAQSLGELHSALLAEQRQAADAALGPAHCPKCARTYLEACPSGWGEGSGAVCEAPLDYNGPCKGYAYLSELAVADKQRFEGRCGVCWGCSGHSPPSTGRREGPIGPSGAAA